jgi:hypothetical protein
MHEFYPLQGKTLKFNINKKKKKKNALNLLYPTIIYLQSYFVYYFNETNLLFQFNII